MGNKLVIFALVALQGCVHYYPSTISTTSLHGKYEKPVRVISGESHAFYILGMGPIGNDSLEAAIEDAQGDAPGDSMVNVFVDRKVLTFPFTYFPLITRITTNIRGTLIKYVEGNEQEVLDKNPMVVKTIQGDKAYMFFVDRDPGDFVRLLLLNDSKYEGYFQGMTQSGKLLCSENKRSTDKTKTFDFGEIRLIQILKR